MAGIKIVDLPALGRDLISTDLLEVSLNGSGSRKITGQEIMNASKLTVGSTPIVSGTVGRLLFQDTGSVLGQSSSLFWNNTNGRLGIGTSSPSHKLHVLGGITDSFKVESTGANLFNQFVSTDGTGEFGIFNDAFYFQPLSTLANGLRFLNGANTVVFQMSQTGNIQIGTTTDAGFRLDVNGTLRSLGFNLLTSTGNHYANGFQTSSTDGTFNFRRFSDNGWVRFSLGASSSFQMAGNTGTGEGQLFASGGGYYWTIYSNGSERMRIPTSGNVLVNTTTDDGFKLDVNGTARISGNTTISAATPILNVNVTNNAQTSAIYMNATDGNPRGGIMTNIATGEVRFLAGTGGYYQTFYNSGAEQMRLQSGSLLIGTTTNAGFRLDVNGTARFYGGATAGAIFGSGTTLNLGSDAYMLATSASNNAGFLISRGAVGQYASLDFITAANTSTGWSMQMRPSATRLDFVDRIGGENIAMSLFPTTRNVAIGTTTDVASSLLTLQSTTKGFLPPRMTNAQRAAIASPAVGLIVYCTDATEGLYVYKSTGWTFMV